MIRRTFLSTLSALAVAPFGWMFGRKANSAALPLVYGVKDSTKPGDLEMDWFDAARFPLGENNSTPRAS